MKPSHTKSLDQPDWCNSVWKNWRKLQPSCDIFSPKTVTLRNSIQRQKHSSKGQFLNSIMLTQGIIYLLDQCTGKKQFHSSPQSTNIILPRYIRLCRRFTQMTVLSVASEKVLKKSHNNLTQLTLTFIIVLNVFMWLAISKFHFSHLSGSF